MKIKFLPQDKEFEILPNQTVLQLAKENGVQIKSVCGGIPSCAECRVQIKSGEYNLLPPSPEEIALIGTAYFVDRSRLSCQMRCFGDIVVDLTEQNAKLAKGSSTKKPRGRAVVASDRESFAVQGSLVLEGKDLELFKDLSGGEQETRKTNELIHEQVTTKAELDRIKRSRR